MLKPTAGLNSGLSGPAKPPSPSLSCGLARGFSMPPITVTFDERGREKFRPAPDDVESGSDFTSPPSRLEWRPTIAVQAGVQVVKRLGRLTAVNGSIFGLVAGERTLSRSRLDTAPPDLSGALAGRFLPIGPHTTLRRDPRWYGRTTADARKTTRCRRFPKRRLQTRWARRQADRCTGHIPPFSLNLTGVRFVPRGGPAVAPVLTSLRRHGTLTDAPARRRTARDPWPHPEVASGEIRRGLLAEGEGMVKPPASQSLGDR
jgi:hypothetical protein